MHHPPGAARDTSLPSIISKNHKIKIPKSTMASMEDQAPVVLTPAQSYSTQEWEQKRAIIIQLYRDEAKILSHVRIILAQQHDFRPTVAMLKKRIKAWDLDRKHKQADMLYALRLAFQRESEGKKTVFCIRGRIVTFHDVKHYFQRKGVRNFLSLMTNRTVATPTTRIECRTPDPSVTVAMNATQNPNTKTVTEHTDLDQDLDVTTLNANPSIVALPDPYQVDYYMMALAVPLSQLNQLIHLGLDCCSAWLESVDIKNSTNGFETMALTNFYLNMISGDLFLVRNIAKAFIHFGHAFDQIPYILKTNATLFLIVLYIVMMLDGHIYRQEIYSQLLRFASQMADIQCSPLSPTRQSLIILQHMSIETRRKSSERVLMSIIGRFGIKSTTMAGGSLNGHTILAWDHPFRTIFGQSILATAFLPVLRSH